MKKLLLVLMAVGFLATMAPSAQASVTRTDSWRFEQQSITPPRPTWYWLKNKVTYTVKTAGECHSLYPCFGNVTWQDPPDWGAGLYHLDHWFAPVFNSGTYANGTKWKSRTIGGQFVGCVTPVLCSRENAYIKLTIKTGGSATHDVWTS